MTGGLAFILDALFPRDVACSFCGAEARVDERGLCADCARETALSPAVVAPAGFSGATAGAAYRGTAVRALRSLKYGDARYLGERFSLLLNIPEEWGIDLVVPVPLHPDRQRQRGYNQSALIAEALAKRLHVPAEEGALSRIRSTSTQTELNADERRENVRGAFKAEESVAGKSVLLVDDMLTTGATSGECALALSSRGARRVYLAAAFASVLTLKE